MNDEGYVPYEILMKVRKISGLCNDINVLFEVSHILPSFPQSCYPFGLRFDVYLFVFSRISRWSMSKTIVLCLVEWYSHFCNPLSVSCLGLDPFFSLLLLWYRKTHSVTWWRVVAYQWQYCSIVCTLVLCSGFAYARRILGVL